jgi:hypothetical protein
MVVKASGFRMGEISARGGYSLLDCRKVASAYERGAGGASAARAVLAAALPGSRLQPSMETGFHSFLGTYVAHLHPVHFNALASQRDSDRLLRRIYGRGKFAWVGYARPGHRLACAVMKAARGRKECVLFLQNHGIIVSSGDPGKCALKAREIEKKARDYLRRRLGMKPFRTGRLRRARGGWLDSSAAAKEFAAGGEASAKFLFPDAAVFFSGAFSRHARIRAVVGKGMLYRLPERAAKAADETFCAHAFIARAARLLGRPAYLPKRETRMICCMGPERHRRKMAGM